MIYIFNKKPRSRVLFAWNRLMEQDGTEQMLCSTTVVVYSESLTRRKGRQAGSAAYNCVCCRYFRALFVFWEYLGRLPSPGRPPPISPWAPRHPRSGWHNLVAIRYCNYYAIFWPGYAAKMPPIPANKSIDLYILSSALYKWFQESLLSFLVQIRIIKHS